MTRLAVIFGCGSTHPTREERAFFRDARPWGFILFKRNIDTPDQVRGLVDSLRETVGDPAAPVLIDQEGGRVQRLGPPHWRRYPPGRAYGELATNDPLERREIARLGARLIAHDLASLGINVDCAPVLDVPEPGAHDIIGDRAYAPGADEVGALGRAAAEGLIAGGVLPVIKHIPGHGRSRADSHAQLPIVDASLAALRARDFGPFRINSDMPMGMTAHLVYSAVDAKRPGTMSRKVIADIIRGEIGFDGLLMSDDLSMKALSGGFSARAKASLTAGCDVVLHCNGAMDEMRAVAEGVKPLAGAALRRAKAAMARLPAMPEPLDVEAAHARFAAAFEGRWAA